MGTNFEDLSKQIMSLVGGSSNITIVSHCYTRLRLTIKNPAKVDQEGLKKTKGVLGLVVRGKEFQVVIGTEVTQMYEKFVTLGDFELAGEIDAKDPEVLTNQSKKNKSNVLMWILDFIAGTFSPVIPVLIAGGLTGAVLTILTTFFSISQESGTYIIFSAINKAAFYFLPVFVGFAAAKKLNINSWLGAFLGTILLYSTIDGAEALNFFGIPVKATTYNTTVFPVLLGVLFMAVVYKFFEKHFPKEIRTVFLPLVTMIIVVPVTLIVLGPIGGVIGNWLSDGVYALYNVAGPLGVLIIGALTPILVFFGMNNALYPILFALFAEVGNDPLIISGMLAANVAVGAACLAVGLKAKKAELKGVAISAGVTGLLGITEPGVYGVLFPLKKPLIGAMIGGGIGGFLAGLLHIAAYSIASPSFVSLVIFIPSDHSGMSNFYFSILVAAVSVIVAFASTWKLCKEEDLA